MPPAPSLARRIDAIRDKGSDGWDIHYKSRAMAEAGEPVLRLTVGEHDTRTDASILDAMAASAAAGNTGYTLGPGKQALREAVSARVQARTGVATSLPQCAHHAGRAGGAVCGTYGGMQRR